MTFTHVAAYQQMRMSDTRLNMIVSAIFASGTIAALVVTNGDQDRSSRSLTPVATHVASPPALSNVDLLDGSWPSEQRTLETWVNFSQLLISHREAELTVVQFHLPGQPPARTKQEAQSLANQLRTRLLQRPQDFGDLVRELSDDTASRRMRGALGALVVSDLPQPFQSAVRHLGVGEITSVIESPAGFHLLRREPRYPRTQFAASRILIHYETAPTAPGTRRRSISREAALQLAEQIRATLEVDASVFGDLAREFSDAADARQNGDLGLYETAASLSRDPAIWAAVSQLEVGQVSPVLDTKGGWQIVLRTDDAPRMLLWAEEILVSHRDSSNLLPGLAAPTRSEQEAAALARELHAEVLATPARFAALKEMACDVERCVTPLPPWTVGRGVPGLDANLLASAFGDIAPTVERTSHGFHILRRLDPADYVPTRGVPVELRLVRTVAMLNQSATPHFEPLLERLRAFQRSVTENLSLETSTAAKVDRVLDNFIDQLASGQGLNIVSILSESDAALRNALGPGRFNEYLRYRQAWYENLR